MLDSAIWLTLGDRAQLSCEVSFPQAFGGNPGEGVGGSPDAWDWQGAASNDDSLFKEQE